MKLKIAMLFLLVALGVCGGELWVSPSGSDKGGGQFQNHFSLFIRHWK